MLSVRYMKGNQTCYKDHICNCHLTTLSIPASNGTITPLTGSRLTWVQQMWKGVHFGIIDEKSMVGQRMFTKVDACLHQMWPQGASAIFGGFHLSIVSDFTQLPPVKDQPLFSSPQQDTALGQLSIVQFHKVYRQQGNDPLQVQFWQLLKNVSTVGFQLSDLEFLQTHYKPNLSPQQQEDFSDAVSLFTTTEVIDYANISQLATLNQPCAWITCKNDG
ncbi:hypothetical protein D9758_015304 [Tetrapyrgos nigripes]|uniref:ATP-dependent DNA helicase n=1 Tax=Tetrapyrgos nigripes TaxID=182062 RepID=A0A8H5FPF2_9AGAR|nr:hypothetical protein D9758_015304 [Tetrapyrgos nigripes]